MKIRWIALASFLRLATFAQAQTSAIPADKTPIVADSLLKQQAVVSWLKANAIPLKMVEAGNGFADLQPLKKMLKDVRVVGLGEATHGNREFFQVKHRLLEFFVRQMGFRVFALEGSYSALQLINDYVMGKMNDGAKALDSQGFAVWNTHEVRAMLDWARSYNASVASDKRVKFIGFDIQVNQPGKDRLLDYLKRTVPERAAKTASFFAVDERELSQMTVFAQGDKANDARAKLAELKDSYTELFRFLDLNKTSLKAKASQAEYEQIRQCAYVLVQFMEVFTQPDPGTASALRDRYMADLFKQLIDREPTGTRVVLWAHNGHISTEGDGDFIPTGVYLRRFYGPAYYALGFSFNQGSFEAREAKPKDPTKRMMREFTVKPASAGSADWYLAQTGLTKFIVDLRAGQTNTDVANWLTVPHLLHSSGGVYDESIKDSYPAKIGKQFDGLLFIDTTTRARPNLSVINVAGRDDK